MKNLFSLLGIFVLCVNMGGCRLFEPTPVRSQHSEINTIESCESQSMSLRKAAECIAEKVYVDQGKVCVGKLEMESPYQQPFIEAFLDELEMAIAGSMSLLERKRLQELIAEHKFQSGDLFNQKEMAEIGKFAKVDYLLVGSVRELTTSYEIRLKMIHMESALVKKASRVDISKDKIPAHLVKEMAKLEIASRGYKNITEGVQGEVMAHFQRGHEAEEESLKSDPRAPLEVQICARKIVKGKISSLQSGDILSKNDRYQFQLFVNRPSYVYAIHVDGKGNVYPVFPVGVPQIGANYDFTNPILAGRKYIFPSSNEEERWFTLEQTEGVEQVGLLVSTKPIQTLEKLMYRLQTGEKQESMPIQEPLLIKGDVGNKRFSKGKNSGESRESHEKEPETITISSSQETIKYPIWFYTR